MSRIRLVHWNEAEAAERAVWLRDAGHDVDATPVDPPALRRLREDPPDAVVIDLTRLPMQGRDVALVVRQYRRSRRVPLVFVEGAPEKIERIRQTLPDATYTTWRRVRGAIARAIAHPPEDPAVPESVLAGYSGTPLPRKLGIREGTVVRLAGAPAGFEKTLGPLPDGATLRSGVRGRGDLIVWFVRSRAALERRIARMGTLAGAGGLWIAWPKKASGVATDVTQPLVRQTGLAAGLVDYKVCAIDPIWTGLLFTRRGGKRARGTGDGERYRKGGAR